MQNKEHKGTAIANGTYSLKYHC